MDNQNLLDVIDIIHLTWDGTNYVVSAGTTDVVSNYIDTQGWHAVLIICVVGVLAASSAVTITITECDTSGGSYVALAAGALTAFAATDDDKMVCVLIKNPKKRFIKVSTVRGDGGNSTLECLLAIKHTPRYKPQTMSTSAGQHIAAPALLVSPSE